VSHAAPSPSAWLEWPIALAPLVGVLCLMGVRRLRARHQGGGPPPRPPPPAAARESNRDAEVSGWYSLLRQGVNVAPSQMLHGSECCTKSNGPVAEAGSLPTSGHRPRYANHSTS
jgi:hypothetical protein